MHLEVAGDDPADGGRAVGDVDLDVDALGLVQQLDELGHDLVLDLLEPAERDVDLAVLGRVLVEKALAALGVVHQQVGAGHLPRRVVEPRLSATRMPSMATSASAWRSTPIAMAWRTLVVQRHLLQVEQVRLAALSGTDRVADALLRQALVQPVGMAVYIDFTSKVGDEVTVKVLEVDLDRERISLSIKQTLEDPWVTFIRENSVGSVVEGVVTKTVPFGAFVSVGDGVEGLVHVSEIAVHRVESPELELSIGQRVQVKVTEMEEERRRVSLSIKQASPDWSERREPPAPAAAAAPTSRPERRPPTRHEFEREPEEERPAVSVDASLEAILQELKERGIGRR